MGRRKKHKRLDSVELNLAAMLDMAFQLLTFFILTFRPSPLEGKIDLRMPPPRSIAAAGVRQVDQRLKSVDPLRDLTVLVIDVPASDAGAIGEIQVGGGAVRSLKQLDRRLGELLADPGLPFEQVVIQAGSDLRYDALMSVIEVCTRQKLASGAPLSKLSFVPRAGDSG